MSRAFTWRSLFALCLIIGAMPAVAAAPRTGADLAQLCIRAAEACISFIGGIAAQNGDDKTICLPDGYRPDHLRQAYIEWAAASDPDLLAREPADQAVLAAFKELYSCEE